MNATLARRQAVLAAVALLAALTAIALARAEARGKTAPDATRPVPVAVAWYEASAGAYGPGRFGDRTACGVVLTRSTRGVAHPVLPCGARIVLSYGRRESQATVIDRGPSGSGRDLVLTDALARELGLERVDVVRWRFAHAAR